MYRYTGFSTVANRVVELTDPESADVRTRAVEITTELEARYWACLAFIEQYPVDDLPDGDQEHHTFAMGFALDLPATPQDA